MMDRRKRYTYDVRVDGRSWIKAARIEPARAAAEAARHGWAKGKKIEIVEITSGAFCPFREE